MRAIVFDRPGEPEVMHLAEVADPVPEPHEVLIRVQAAGVNRADLLQRLGRYPAPAGASDVLGLELAGEVVALGSRCTERQIGDRVMALVAGGAYATLAVAPEATTWLMPGALDSRHAAAIPESFLTSWLSLFDLGGLQAGETVLVHAGASGIGTAAIQTAHAAGATVLATAGTDAKLDLCRALGADLAIHRDRDDFASVALGATHGTGVHLIVDLIGATYWTSNTRALRPGGRLVLMGFLGGSAGELDLAPILRKNLTVRGTTLRGRTLAEKASLVERCGAFVLPRLAAGSVRAVVDRTFLLADAAAAHHYMADNRSQGKIVLEP